MGGCGGWWYFGGFFVEGEERVELVDKLGFVVDSYFFRCCVIVVFK